MKIIIRTDADYLIGHGHVMRCLALAQAWQDKGGQAIFAMRTCTSNIEERLKAENMEIFHSLAEAGSAEDAAEIINLSNQIGSSKIIVDGYQFGADYQRIIKAEGLSLLFIDDYGHAGDYCADLVLNQNIFAYPDIYTSCESYTKLLLGTRYALLRSEFLQRYRWNRQIPGIAKRVLVTLGGSDPHNVTSKVITALRQISVAGLESVIIVGGSNPHYSDLKATLTHSDKLIRLEHNIIDMPSLMAWADVAVTAGGSTCWELAFMGLPSLIIVLADNQDFTAKWLGAMGVSMNLGSHEFLEADNIAQALTQVLLAKEKREEMARKSQEIVDGEGISRVIMHLRGEKIRLRRACEEDCELFWNWANEQEVRRKAFSSDPIPWEGHVSWFRHSLRNPDCFLFLALDDQDIPIGQIRFDSNGRDEVDVDVSIDKEKRGLGYGNELINLSVEEIFRISSLRSVHAFVKPDNIGSSKAFEKARFKNLGIEKVKGNVALHYVRTRNHDQLVHGCISHE